jgi:DNA repair exonuclease SbcCD ATPase subunit
MPTEKNLEEPEAEVETSDEEIKEVVERPVKTPAEAEDKVSELQRLISDVRQDQARDRKERDTIIGALKAEIEELHEALGKTMSALEKARKRPQQTMVTPPPPPTEDNVDEPLQEGKRPARQHNFLQNIW